MRISMLLVALRVAIASPATFEREDDCLAILAQTNAAPTVAAALRALAHLSTERSVPILQPYLSSAEWGDLARGALETLNHPSAAAALRQAAEPAAGGLLAGLFDSLGRRRDADAVPLAARHLRDADPEVAAAAARALARIANEPAIEALIQAASEDGPALPPHLADALCTAADEALRRGASLQLAARALTPLERASPPPHLLGPLLRLRGEARPDTDIGTVLETIPHPAAHVIATHLLAHGDLPVSTNLSVETVSVLPAPLGSALLIRLVSAHSNQAVAILTSLAEHPDASRREAALAIAVRAGLPSVLPFLWAQARDGAEAGFAEARHLLASFPNDAADHVLEQHLHAASNTVELVLALDLLGQRAWAPAAQAVLNFTAHPEAEVRLAAWSALRDMSDVRILGPLLKRWTQLSFPDEISPAEKALYAVVGRMGPGGQDLPIVAELSNAVFAASVAARPPLLRALQRIGGPAAVRVVAEVAASPDPDIQEMAARALIEWPDVHALPWLDTLAGDERFARLRPLVVRALVRWIPALDAPAEARFEKLHVWESSLASDDDRRAFIAALGHIPCGASLQRLRVFLSLPPLADEAAAAILRISEAQPPLPTADLKPVLEEARAAPIAKRLRAEIERRLAQLPAP